MRCAASRSPTAAPETAGPRGSRPCETAEHVRGTAHRHLRRAGGRHITLIEREAIDAVNEEGDVTIVASETRRNLVTDGVPLNHLVGRELRVGDVVLRGVRLNEPCVYLESMTRTGVRQAMLHRCGLRAEVVTGGVIRPGDRIVAFDG